MSKSDRHQEGGGKGAEQRRDAVLLRLLKMPPQPRPTRDRNDAKSSQNGASRASDKNA